MIVLLTDFQESEYKGVMKGVIYTIFQNAKIVDLCNSIKHYNIKEAAWILLNNFKYFPKDENIKITKTPSQLITNFFKT